jgi:hypothetical protein
MSDQPSRQYEPQAFSPEEFTQIFRKNFLLWISYASFSASLSFAIHEFVSGYGSDRDMAYIFGALFFALVFVAQFLLITKSAWEKICERREVAFLIGQIKKKYDTTGMVFNDRFEYSRRVTGVRTDPSGSKPIKVIFVFVPRTNEAMYLRSSENVDFYPTPLFGTHSY